MSVDLQQWRYIDWLVFSVRLLLYTSSLAYYWIERPSEITFFYVFLLFVLSYIIPHIFWRPGYKNITFYSVSEIIFSGTATIYLNQFEPITFLMISSFMIGYLQNKQTLRWSAPVILLFIPFLEGFLRGSILHSLIHVLTYIAAFGIGFCIYYVDTSNLRVKKLLSEIRKRNTIIEEQNNALIQYSDQIEQITLVEERIRLSRDLHDTIGHTFTSSIVGIEASIYLIDKNPQKAKDKLLKIQSIMSKDLEVVRYTIHSMFDNIDVISLSDYLNKIITKFEEVTSSEVYFLIKGKELDVSKTIKFTIIRCLQEALTNAKRHGKASKLVVQLIFDMNQITLTISDNGIGFENMNYGFGLQSMKDRLTTLHGTLEIQSKRKEGSIITCNIPIGGEKNE
ncbi:sensor histidine kinase [Alkalihalobacillus sp. LMS39]|uniref:sensor histidine kinase n=1 Tax=Alkalihalobacillus sp. LMS39 TaxID=2924032 RepID=UPI001FB32FFC|nr:sensor histidine kinase [Alkalihalobacillus sp. LMS39]UOE94797.1 sensor histidine kinase [Alkalihalobacillus sp. LMS39]